MSNHILFENSIQKELMEEEHKYSRINRYKFGFITWNLGGKGFDLDMNIEDTLTSQNETLNDPPDVFFAGFQETRKLNAFALIKGESKSKISEFKF